LRGDAPPDAFLDPCFWVPAWASVLREGAGGLIVVNAIGATPDAVDDFSRQVLKHVPDETAEVVAGVVEPCGAADRQWTPFVPRPSILALGLRSHLDLFATSTYGSPALLDVVNGGAPWAAKLCEVFLSELGSGNGLVAQWRWIPAFSNPS